MGQLDAELVAPERFTVLFVAATSQFSLAAALLGECLRAAAPREAALRFLVRSYERGFKEVDNSFVRDVLLHRPNVLALSCFFWNHDENLALARVAKALDPRIVTMLGGPEVGHVRDAMRIAEREPSVDAILCGEGEVAFADWVLALARGETPGPFPGTVVRRPDGLLVGDDSYPIADLSRIPPIFHAQNAHLASCPNESFFTIQTLRGCKNRCSYCLYTKSRVRFFPLERIAEEIAFLCARGVHQVRIADSHFGGSVDRAHQILEIIRQHNRCTVFSLYPDPEHLSKTFLRAARSANCQLLSLGIQSLDRTVAVALQRPLAFESACKAVSTLKLGGEPRPRADLMYGLPGQSARSLAEDAASLTRSGVREILFSPLMLFPGTPLGEEARARGLTTLPTAQHFAFPEATGAEGYAEAMLVIEAHGILTALPRTEAYLRMRGAPIRPAVVSSASARAAVVELADALRSSANEMRRRIGDLVQGSLCVLDEIRPCSTAEKDHVAELARLDLLTHAMERRSSEIARDAFRRPTHPTVLFAEDVPDAQWVVHRDAWFEHFDLPSDFEWEPGETVAGNADHAQAAGTSIACVFACSTRSLWVVDRADFERLRGFRLPCSAPSAWVERSEGRSFLRTWVERGVLDLVMPR